MCVCVCGGGGGRGQARSKVTEARTAYTRVGCAEGLARLKDLDRRLQARDPATP